MTGPEHYKAAEELAVHAADLAEQISNDAPHETNRATLRDELQVALTMAQVHATLAGAAAAALGLDREGPWTEDLQAWEAVASAHRVVAP